MATCLNVGSGLVSNFHQKLLGRIQIFNSAIRIQKQIQDVQVDRGSQVVDVGDEAIFSSLFNHPPTIFCFT
jgi:hypothetical protein